MAASNLTYTELSAGIFNITSVKYTQSAHFMAAVKAREENYEWTCLLFNLYVLVKPIIKVTGS